MMTRDLLKLQLCGFYGNHEIRRPPQNPQETLPHNDLGLAVNNNNYE